MNKSTMNLHGVTTLIVDDDRYCVGLLSQMLRGFGADQPVVVENGEAAMKLLRSRAFELCILEAQLPDMAGAELMRWIRQQPPPVRFLPALIVTAYSQLSHVTAARDSGAHSVIKKPVSPQILFDHIGWAANSQRQFVEIGAYTGPDRRFKFTGPPEGIGRRESDLSADVGEATEPNLSQAEIDAMIKPTKIFAE